MYKEPNFQAHSFRMGADTFSSRSSVESIVLMHKSRKLSHKNKGSSKMEETAQYMTGTFKNFVIEE